MSAEFVKNPDALTQILHSDGVRALLQEKITAIADKCNATLTHGEDELGYQAAVDSGSRRLRGRVWAAGAYAKNSNAKHLTLIRELSNR